MKVSDLSSELEMYKNNGWGNCEIYVFDDNKYLPIQHIEGYCGKVLVFTKQN